MSDEGKRQLTLDEEVILVMPYRGTVGSAEIKAKLGEITGLKDESLENHSAGLEKSIGDNEKTGYLWRLDHPFNNELIGYMLSTRGVEYKATLKVGIGEGKLLIGPVPKK